MSIFLDCDPEMEVQDIASGLREAQALFETEYTEAERSRMVLDPVMLENAFCKFKGAVNAGLA